MISDRVWLVGLLPLACVVHEQGTSVSIAIEASPVVVTDLGQTVTLERAVLLIHEIHLEACPEEGPLAFLRALSPIGVAHAHGGYRGGDGAAIQAMSLLVPLPEALEIHPPVGRYCGITPLFAPGGGQPTLQIDLEVASPGALPKQMTITTDAWLRPELALPALVLDEARPEVGLTLAIDGGVWWDGVDVQREDPALIGARLVERLGAALTVQATAIR